MKGTTTDTAMAQCLATINGETKELGQIRTIHSSKARKIVKTIDEYPTSQSLKGLPKKIGEKISQIDTPIIAVLTQGKKRLGTILYTIKVLTQEPAHADSYLGCEVSPTYIQK